MAERATPRRDDLYKAFVAGFQSSGEGWNGEYPFDDHGEEVAADEGVQSAFAEWYGDAAGGSV